MEEIYSNDIKNIVPELVNPVPKVEPNDEYILCGEFVDTIPPFEDQDRPAFTEDDIDPLGRGITGDKDIKPSISTNDSHKGSNHEIVKQTPSVAWVYKLKKTDLQEELKKLGLPSNVNIKEGRKILSSFLKEDYKPPVVQVQTESALGSSASDELKGVVKDCLQELLTIKTDIKNEPEDHIYDDPLESQPSDDPSSDERNTQHQQNSITPNKHKKGSPWVPQNDSVPSQVKPMKKGKKLISYQDEGTSESDSDDNYSPRRKLTVSFSRSKKKKPTMKKGILNEGRINPETLVPNKNMFINNSSKKPMNSTQTLQSKVSTQPIEKTQHTKKRRENDENEVEMNGSLWACCDIEFENFGSFNQHKMQEHHIEELKCSHCEDQLFTSLVEIEKHYLDVHINTKFKCLDCRLVFGVKSSYFIHKANCSQSQRVCSGIFASILDFAVTRKKVEVNENTAFRLSCCGKMFGKFKDFVGHKSAYHNIALLTCGLCLCTKESETQLREHYQQFHFPKLWEEVDLEKNDNAEVGAPSTAGSSSTRDDGGLNAVVEDTIPRTQTKCTSLQDGILCQCFDCSKLMKKFLPSKAVVKTNKIANNKLFACEICSLSFSFKSGLERHLKTHEGLKLYPCDECNVAFTQRTTLKNHIKQKHSTNPVRETCNICFKHFYSLNAKRQVQIHIRNVHCGVNKRVRFKCEHCQKTFSQKKCLERHHKEVHLRGNQFTCDNCNLTFYSKKNLICHIQSRHLPQEKIYTCNICSHTFNTAGKFYRHKNSIHSSDQFACEVCGKIFAQKTLVDNHMATHSKETPFLCKICGKGFKREGNLQQHEHTHSDNRPHVCDICGQTFKLRTHVKQHMAVHGLIKKYKCGTCDKMFARKAELNSHISYHGI